MTLAVIAAICCVALLALLTRRLEKSVDSVRRWHRKTHERISHLEVNDVTQDIQLDQHKTTITNLQGEVKQLGRDVGWSDDKQSTEEIDIVVSEDLLKKSKNPPDE